MNAETRIAREGAVAIADPRPRSAVSTGVGLAGLAGLFAALAIAEWLGANGPLAAICAVVACGLPMVLWSLLIDKVHRNPSTGLDWSRPLAPREATREISLVKLGGLWATWSAIAACYCIARWYWDGSYLFAMRVMGWALPFAAMASVPYILWIDRRLAEPRDGAWHFGQWLIGRGHDRAELIEHFRSWAVKGFFLAFMISIVPGNWMTTLRWSFAEIAASPVAAIHWMIAVMFTIDVVFATVGYALTLKPLDAHIRTANPYAAGWTAALICYPPFVLMNDGGPLDYRHNIAEWDVWLQAYPALLVAVGGALVVLTAIYAWATVAFGIRFSNLTNRGILTHGPYAWTRHPAYLAKNAYWWLATLPFLATSGNPVDMIRNTALLALVSAVYYWRARTEERHLLADPAYREYYDWMERNGAVPRLWRWLMGKPGSKVVPAE